MSYCIPTFRINTGGMLLCSWEQGVFETQKSGNKTSLGEIGLNIRTHASPKVAQDQVSRGVSILYLHAAAVANVLWKLLAKLILIY